MGAAVIAASLPDIDVIAGLLLHGDAWKLHRQGTHTMGFALSAGMLAGIAGIVSAESIEGERDLVMDAMTGALLVGSHIVLDKLPFPYLPANKAMPKRDVVRNETINWIIDGIVYGVIAWKLMPRERSAAAA
jgi:hypothetical protein